MLLDRLRREAALRSASVLERERERGKLPTGVGTLDEAIGGGLPRGRIVEAVGSISSGRTAFLLAALASATARGEHVAFVDPCDSLDPEAAADAGAALERILWIRPRGIRETLRAADLVLEAGGFGIVAVEPGPGAGARCRPPVPWARLSLRAERSGSVLLVLGMGREAGTFAAVALGFARATPRWIGGGAAPCLLDRIDVRIEVLKLRGAGPGVRGRPLRWVARMDAA